MSAVDISPSPRPSLSSTDVRVQQVKIFLDNKHIQLHVSWMGTLLMDSDDFSNSDSSNLNALEFAGKAEKGTPCSSVDPKYFCPMKYSTTNGFTGAGYKTLFMSLYDSSEKCGFTIIQKVYYKLSFNEAGLYSMSTT